MYIYIYIYMYMYAYAGKSNLSVKTYDFSVKLMSLTEEWP